MEVGSRSPWTMRCLILGWMVAVALVVGVVVYFVTKNAYEDSGSSVTGSMDTTTTAAMDTTTKSTAAMDTTTTSTAAMDTTTKSTTTTARPVDLLAIPEGFMMGTATAAYQVEGAWDADGKGENIWDHLCHNTTTQTLVANKDNGDVACDSYHLYKTDVQMVKSMGFDVYRFSIAWSRVLPNGTKDIVNELGIQYYHNLIDELLANNIIPLVTLYHWDLPQALENLGGWTNSSIADWFCDYADLMFKEYGDKVKWWLTLNEPKQVHIGYGSEQYAPALNDHGVSDYLAVHNLLRAHGKAYKLYNETYKPIQQGKLGITLDSSYYQPLNASSIEDQEAASRAFTFSLGIYSHPIFSKEGNYPAVVRERVDKNSFMEGRTVSRLPYFTDEEVDMIRGSFDFFGFNHYYYANTTNLLSGPDPSFDRDSQSTSYSNDSYMADALKKLLNWIRVEYDNPPVFVTENGCPSDAGLNDTIRIEKYHGFIKGMLEAIYEDGCNVIGYTAWSIMDNFEWMFGYTKKFGLWEVDYTTQTRTIKYSGRWFKKFLTTRRLPNVTDYM